MLKKYQLRNGTKIVQYSSPKSPVVSVQVWVRTGSADERKGQEGLSHFIEHLLFKGTQKYKVGEIASIIEGSGGQLNAYTSFDQTVFYITISKEFVDSAMDALSQMMGHPLFDTEEIDNEREVVVEEIKRGLDNPSRQASQSMFSLAYKSHPYGIPVIGYEKIVRGVSKKKILDYFHSRYVTENMFIVVAGDFDHAEMKQKVKQHFADFSVRKLKKVVRKKEPKQLRPRVKVEQNNFSELRLNITWRLPKATHQDVPGLEILAMILGQGGSSRLYAKLRNEKSLVTSIGTYAYIPKDPGVFVVSARAKSQDIAQILDEILNEIENLLANGVSKEELKKAVLNHESEELFSQETVDGIAGKIGSFEFLLEDPTYYKKYLKQMRGLDTKEIRRLAKKYLKWENMCVSVSTPENTKQVKAVTNSFVKKYKAKTEKAAKTRNTSCDKPKYHSAKKSAHKNQQVKVVELENGSQLIAQVTTDVPTVNLQMAMRGGQRAESKSNMGICNLFSDVWGCGTNTMSEKDFNSYLESNCLYLNTFSGRNTLGAKLNTTSSQFELGVDSFFELLDHNKIDESIIAREKKQIIESIENREDHPAQIAVQLLNENLFPNHPYAFDVEGSKSTLEAMTQKDLAAFKNELFSAKNSLFVAVGDFNLGYLTSKLNAYISSMPNHKIDWPHISLEPLLETKQIHYPLQKEQSHIVLAYRGLKITDQERYALKLMNSVLSGQGGRLFLELRDKESLAYSVSPIQLLGIDTGYYGAYIGCSPEKAQKSIAMLEAEFKKLMEQSISDDELMFAKRNLIGKYDIGLQRNAALANNYLFDCVYGVELEEVLNFKDQLKAVTKSQIQELAQKLFSKNSVKVCVGPNSPF